MPQLKIRTQINAPVQRCFDLSRSIDLHQLSTAHTGEKAVAGRTSGLIELGETVTWRAKHFGIWQHLTSEIIQLEPNVSFTDKMIKGAFKSIVHHHRFFFNEGVTTVEDEFNYESPLGVIGRIVNAIVLNRYLSKLLIERNSIIKVYAETDKWKKIIM